MESGLSLYALARVQRHTLKYVSRLWIEKHGEHLAETVSAILMRPVTVDDLFPHWDRPDERPSPRRKAACSGGPSGTDRRP
jgi:hypothetical protein